MIPEFFKFCAELFPSISPYTAEGAKKAAEQFENVSGNHLTTHQNSFDCLQGDVFSEIPFIFLDSTGEVYFKKYKAMLLSNTCDATRDDNLLFAAVRPFSELTNNQSIIASIKKNIKYSSLYLPDNLLIDEFVDFEMITTIPRVVFYKFHENNDVERLITLSSVGYYMFICKLTIFFLRPEDPETNSERY